MEDDYAKDFPVWRILRFSPQTPLAWQVALPDNYMPGSRISYVRAGRPIWDWQTRLKGNGNNR